MAWLLPDDFCEYHISYRVGGQGTNNTYSVISAIFDIKSLKKMLQIK
jgi:hypothetical protein